MAVTALAAHPHGSHRDPEPGLRVTREAGASVVWLTGEHDIATVPAVRAVLADLAVFDRDVVVDLSEVAFIEGAVISALRAGKTTLLSRDRWLSVRGASPRARRLLGLCGCDDLFEARTVLPGAGFV